MVLSSRNEEATLPELIRRLQLALRRIPVPYEIIFVNHASRDGSLEVLRCATDVDPAVKTITMSRRFGVYECMMAGLAHASGDAVITLDSDLQDPPEVIPDLVREWHAGADVTYTIRLSRAGAKRRDSWCRLLQHRR